MTSFTAGSSWDNLATLDPNGPIAGTSNYVAPHRMTLMASYSPEWFGDLETRFTLMGYRSQGQPGNLVMGSRNGDFEGDGFNGRHLLYIPSTSDPNVVFNPGFDMAGFDDWIQRNGYDGTRGGFVPRNDKHADWTTRFDFRFDQEIALFGDARGKLFLKIYKLGNLLNDDWGQVTDAEFFSQQIIQADIDAEGRYVYLRYSDRSVYDVLETRSLWQVRLGIELIF